MAAFPVIPVIAAALLAVAPGALFAQAPAVVSVPAGSFTRGGGFRVGVSAFAMTATEITEGQYRKCVEGGGCTPAHYDDGKCLIWSGGGFRRVAVPPEMRGDALPVVCVTWQQARAYCAGVGMRLPTEAQWEYAALGGGDGRYAWGDAPPSGGRCALSAPRPVGGFPPNGYGLYDMTGNAWEWTADFYAADAYESSAGADPKGPDAGYYRVVRGGGWYSGPDELPVRNRHWFSASGAEASVGFRCVK
jgi:formylglycine-generating enzyme required for sulfatase activity